MGACASVPKAMRGKATGVPPPEPREEETSAAAVEETAAEKAEGGNVNDKKKVEKPKEPAELVTNKSEIEALKPPVPATVLEEGGKTPAVEQKS